jgi:predicted dehydrogenase
MESAMAARPKIAGKTPPGKVNANDKIVMGFIGVAGRGSGHIDWFGKHKDVEPGAVCDVYQKHLDAAVAKTGGKAKPYKDFRRLLEQKDIDAVVVATPPHWHPLITVLACEAGKDVYVEKPMSLAPAEARAMVKAARANNRVTQVGTQIHADENFHRCVEIVRSGVLGKISAVRVGIALNEAPNGIGFTPDSDPPEGLDWDLWLGPLPKMAFNRAKFEHGQHRYFAELAGSWINELGPHIGDLAFWALDPGPPKTVQAMGGKFAIKDMSTIPDTMEVLCEYDGLVLTISNTCANCFGGYFQKKPEITRNLSVTFQGVNGTLMADYGRYELVSEGDRLKDVKLPEPSLPRSPGHEREFLDCVKSRKQPSCSVAYHYPLHIALNLGHIAMKVGRKVRWDEQKGEIVGDKEANRLVTPQYRAPWDLPA